MLPITNKPIDYCSGLIYKIDLRCDYLFFVMIAGFVFAGIVLLLSAGVCWYIVYKRTKRPIEKFDSKKAMLNESYSIKSNSSSGSNGDRRLAQSAQMYHYQHQKQQMIALEKANDEIKENSNNSENEEDDYTVYECPGLAKTNEIVVKNPLFKEEDFSNAVKLNECVSIQMEDVKKERQN